MKRILICLGFTALTSAAFSQIVDPRCPVFRRNNGNKDGCDAKISLYYPTCPTMQYYVIGISYNGAVIPGLNFTTGPCAGGRVDVCVQGSNLPTASKLSLLFSDAPNGSLLFSCGDDTSGGPLPVKLSAFNARRNGNGVQLNWQTGFEADLKAFIIQRKSGLNFEDIATIDPSNIINGNFYQFSDANASKTSSQYRLKIVDIDGSFTYSWIRSVKGSAGNLDFMIYPNPAMGKTQISIADSDDWFEVTLLDNAGRTLRNFKVKGSQNAELNNLPKGNHLLRVTNKLTGESAIQKINVL
jgi:hypothetical protein